MGQLVWLQFKQEVKIYTDYCFSNKKLWNISQADAALGLKRREAILAAD